MESEPTRLPILIDTFDAWDLILRHASNDRAWQLISKLFAVDDENGNRTNEPQ